MIRYIADPRIFKLLYSFAVDRGIEEAELFWEAGPAEI
jgi:hypothetical protein